MSNLEDVYYEKIIKVLLELKLAYPEYNLGRHLRKALVDHSGAYTWNKTDRQFFNSITEYKERLMSKMPYVEESAIDKIIKDGMNLDTILQEDEEDDD